MNQHNNSKSVIPCQSGRASLDIEISAIGCLCNSDILSIRDVCNGNPGGEPISDRLFEYHKGQHENSC